MRGTLILLTRTAALTALTALVGPLLLAQDSPKAALKEEKKQDWPSQDAVIAKNTITHLNQSFGPDEKQKLDVYSPKDTKDAPAVVFVHGGEWTKGDKANVSFKPKFLNENGIVFVSVNYRLSPAHKHPAHVSDIATALSWVRGHAAEIGAAPDKIVLMGHSAGCHLATLIALDPKYLAKEKLKPADLRGVAAWSGGMYDLVERAKGDGQYPKYIRQTFGDEEPAWRDASPVAHVGEAPMPAFLFIVTERPRPTTEKKAEAADKKPELSPADRLAGLIRSAKGQAEVRPLPNRSHFDANHLLGAPDDTTGQILLDFVRRVAK